MPDQPAGLPHLVTAAKSLAASVGFNGSCTDEVGRLLRSLAARTGGPILELGTGCGVGSAWIISGRRPGTPFVTVEANAALHGPVSALLAFRDVEVLLGDWREALCRGPFSLAFVDVAEAKDSGAEELIAAVLPGGTVVLDDFEPGPLYRGEPDERWERWMKHPQLESREVLVEQGSAVILARRKRQ